MTTATERQALVTVAGIDGYFSAIEGGRTGAQDVSREFDGGSLVPEVLAGPAQTEDITVRRPYKPERDSDLLARLRPLVGRWRTSVTEQPTDADLVPQGRPSVYTALLVSVSPGTADANSGTPRRLEIVFAVSGTA